MSYCPCCKKDVNLVEKLDIANKVAKGAVKGASYAAQGMSHIARESEHGVHQSSRNSQSGTTFNGLTKLEAEYKNEVDKQKTNNFHASMREGMDQALGPDYYWGCEACGTKIVHTHAHTREEYLVANYELFTVKGRGISAFIVFAVLAYLGNKFFSSNAFMRIILPMIAAGAYYGAYNFVPHKIRAIIGAVTDNVITAFGLSIGWLFCSTIAIFGVQAITSKGWFRETLTGTLVLGFGAFCCYALYHFNKEIVGEMKETWKLLENPSQTHHPEEENKAA